MAQRDSHARSIIKTVTWRITATATTFALAYLVFHDDPNVAQKAATVAGIEIVVKLIVYYLHERAWTNIVWGRQTEKE